MTHACCGTSQATIIQTADCIRVQSSARCVFDFSSLEHSDAAHTIHTIRCAIVFSPNRFTSSVLCPLVRLSCMSLVATFTFSAFHTLKLRFFSFRHFFCEARFTCAYTCILLRYHTAEKGILTYVLPDPIKVGRPTQTAKKSWRRTPTLAV